MGRHEQGSESASLREATMKLAQALVRDSERRGIPLPEDIVAIASLGPSITYHSGPSKSGALYKSESKNFLRDGESRTGSSSTPKR